jgi:hypothetical protein
MKYIPKSLISFFIFGCFFSLLVDCAVSPVERLPTEDASGGSCDTTTQEQEEKHSHEPPDEYGLAHSTNRKNGHDPDVPLHTDETSQEDILGSSSSGGLEVNSYHSNMYNFSVGIRRAIEGSGTLDGFDVDSCEDPDSISMKMIFPRQNTVIQSSNVRFKFDVQGYEISEDSGQYIHLIIDRQYHYKCFDAMDCEVDDLTSGKHSVIAVPARAWGELIKNENAHAIMKFSVDAGGQHSREHDDLELDTDPFIVIVLPQSEHIYSTNSTTPILFDFLVKNINLSHSGTKLFYKLLHQDSNQEVTDNLVEYPSTWHFSNLPSGHYFLSIRLRDRSGNDLYGEGTAAFAEFNVYRKDFK